MNFHILTLFPEMFSGPLQSSILKRAQDSGTLNVVVQNLREYTTDRHQVADDSPYGGGPGMVMKAEPITAAFDAIQRKEPIRKWHRVFLSPQGEVWNQELAQELAKKEAVVLLCGHYEGIDERARELCIDQEISIGDYVLTGGELPAMVVLDSIARLLPGVLGNEESALQDSFSGDGLLDHPHYTRPEEFRGLKVPEVLLSGHHKRIQEWRRIRALERTIARRPDIIRRNFGCLTDKERLLINDLMNETL